MPQALFSARITANGFAKAYGFPQRCRKQLFQHKWLCKVLMSLRVLERAAPLSPPVFGCNLVGAGMLVFLSRVVGMPALSQLRSSTRPATSRGKVPESTGLAHLRVPPLSESPMRAAT